MTPGPRAAVALCLALTAAALFPTLRNGFTTWDDPQYILENPLVREISPGGILALFTTPEHAGNYHPVTLLAVAAERALFGDSPFGYHLVSLLLHLGVTFLVHRLVLALTRSPVAAFGAALLFGVHPLHVEPVAWLADQKDPLYSIFYIGAALAYVRSRETDDPGILYRRVFPLFTLSLLSKGLAVTMPVVLLLIDLHREGRIGARALKEKIPFFALSLAFGVMAIIAQSSAGAVAAEAIDTPLEKVLYAGRGYVLYIVKLAVPYGLSPWYPYPREVPGHYWIFPVIASGIVAAAIASRKKYPVVFTGIAWYSVTVAPVLQLLQVGNAEMADRYAYLPSAGILMTAAWAFARLLERFESSKAARSALLTGAGVLVLVLAVLTFRTSAVWHDGATLWGRVIEVFPGSAKGWFNRGYAFHTLGRFAEAVTDYDRAIALEPSYPYARSNRGITRFAMGEREKSLDDLTRELSSRPGDPEVLFWRGNVLASLGRYEEAAASFTALLEVRPGDFPATVRRGLVYSSARNYPKAEEDFSRAIALQPSQPNLWFNRGNVRAGMGRWNDAVADYSAVLRLAPGDRDAFYARGIASFLMGDTTSACSDLKRAASLGSAQADTAIAEICAR